LRAHGRGTRLTSQGVLRVLARVMTLLDMWVRAAWRSTVRLRRPTAAASKKSDRRQHLNAERLGGSARPVLVGVVAVGSLLLTADTLLQAGGGNWSAMLPARRGSLMRRASGGGANSTTVVAAASEEHQAEDELARFRIDPRTSSAFDRLEQWAYRSDRGGGSGGSGGGQATIEEAVVEARRVQHAVQARLARLNAQAALLQTYLGVGGAGGDTQVVLWLRLARGDGDQTGATAVAAISKMRNSLPLSLEVESGWSLEGARVLPPHSSLPP
jgi:hypothetical protein